MEKPRKILFTNNLSPGDIVMMLYGLKSLHETNPGKFLTGVRASVPELLYYNQYITELDEHDPEVEKMESHYPCINYSNQNPVRFVTGYGDYFAEILNVPVRPTVFSGIVPMSHDERTESSEVFKRIGKDVPYWIINAGHKLDYTCKAWAFERYQEVVDCFPHVWFVQMGSKEHIHPRLTGHNLINMVGETSIRDLIKLVYNSFGVISPVTFAMHLSYAVPAHPRFGRRSRASIVLGGGREPAWWTDGPNQQFIHTNGMLPCCDNGGCWRSRVVPLYDGADNDTNLCELPVQMSDGQWIGKCMSLITASDVARHIERYMAFLDYEPRF